MRFEAPSPVGLPEVLASAGLERRRHGTLRVALLDTDFLLNQVRDAVNAAPSLLTGFSGIQLRQYASQHVLSELYRDDGHGHPTKWHKLSEQAAAAGVATSPDIFREAFEKRLGLPHG